MRNDAVMAKPVMYDFAEGYPERWEPVLPDLDNWSARKCRKWLDDAGYDYKPGEKLAALREQVQTAMECDDKLSPMMNYAYPLPNSEPENAPAMQSKLTELPLVVVFLDGEPYLALTGGGTDLSWEICAAYMALDYLPPFHFCDLADMAGKADDVGTRAVLAACKRSCELVELWAAGRRRDLGRLAETMAKRSSVR